MESNLEHRHVDIEISEDVTLPTPKTIREIEEDFGGGIGSSLTREQWETFKKDLPADYPVQVEYEAKIYVTVDKRTLAKA